MRRIIAVVLIFLVTICLIACSHAQPDKPASYSEDYLKGKEAGYHNAMIDLLYASGNLKFLSPGDTWDSLDFTLKLDGPQKEVDTNSGNMTGDVCFYLTTKSMTLEESFRDPAGFLLYVFADDTDRVIFSEDSFYYFAILETQFEDTEDYKESHYAQASVNLYDEEDSLAILLAVNGNLYCAIYSAK